jgi:hypothetical protein
MTQTGQRFPQLRDSAIWQLYIDVLIFTWYAVEKGGDDASLVAFKVEGRDQSH